MKSVSSSKIWRINFGFLTEITILPIFQKLKFLRSYTNSPHFQHLHLLLSFAVFCVIFLLFIIKSFLVIFLNGFLHSFLNLLCFVNLLLDFPNCFSNFLFLYSLHSHFPGILFILSQNIFSPFLAHLIIYLWVHNYANLFFKNSIMALRVSTSSIHNFSYSSRK